MNHCKIIEDDQNLNKIKDDELTLKISKLYKVLSDKNRTAILYVLKNKNMCVHELMKYLGQEQSLVSHQLKILRDANIVRTSRRGNHVVYSLADDHVNILLDVAKEHVEENKNEKTN